MIPSAIKFPPNLPKSRCPSDQRNFPISDSLFFFNLMDADTLHWLSQQDIPASAWVTFLASVAFVVLVFKFVVLSNDAEAPVTIHVPPPEQCQPGWKGEVLKEPAIKVASPPIATIEDVC